MINATWGGALRPPERGGAVCTCDLIQQHGPPSERDAGALRELSTEWA
jgi:hypothetical protein